MPSAHVVPNGAEWILKIDTKEHSRHKTQVDAWSAGRKYLAANGGGEISIHATDGTVRAKDTIAPGNDPRSSKG